MSTTTATNPAKLVKTVTELADLGLNHPTRLQVATHLLDTQTASPNEISKLIGETLGATAYHVRTLQKANVIVLARETRRRGAVEHHYKLTTAARRKILKAIG